MRTRRSLVLGIVLCLLTLAYSSSILPHSVRSSGPASVGRPNYSPIESAGTGIPAGTDDWTVGAPISSGNLTVFPVLAKSWHPTEQFITLDEGLRSGGVTITELGGAGRSAHRDAQVNTLSLTNKTGKTLILLAGEMLIGGKQDRIVDHDRLVPSDDLPMELGVFCVEHGRWQGSTASFGQTRTSGGSPPHGGRNLVEPGIAGGSVQIANPAVRERAEASKSQTEVWRKVAESTSQLGATSRTGALTRAYQDVKVGARSLAYQREIKARLSARNIVGLIVSINGTLVTADIFANPVLYRRYQSKLLESYALEAISAGRSTVKQADIVAARAFLSRVQGDPSSDGSDGIYRLTEHKSAGNSSFELESVSSSRRLLVHFNRITAR